MTKVLLVIVDDQKAREFVEDAKATDNLVAYIDKDGRDVEMMCDSVGIVNG